MIIGRNNSGKSHLLDLVEALCSGQLDGRGWQYRCRGVLDEASLRRSFPESTSGGDLGGNHWMHHGRYFVGREITWTTDSNGVLVEALFNDNFQLESAYGGNSTQIRRSKLAGIVQEKKHILTGKSFRRLLADRDVQPEGQEHESRLEANGQGATNTVRRFLLSTDTRSPREVVRHELLNALNSIFGTDGKFSEILSQLHEDEPRDHWEIYLGEEMKGLVPLSKSGSGLKYLSKHSSMTISS